MIFVSICTLTLYYINLAMWHAAKHHILCVKAFLSENFMLWEKSVYLYIGIWCHFDFCNCARTFHTSFWCGRWEPNEMPCIKVSPDPCCYPICRILEQGTTVLLRKRRVSRSYYLYSLEECVLCIPAWKVLLTTEKVIAYITGIFLSLMRSCTLWLISDRMHCL